MKVIYTRILAKNIFLTFLAFIIILSVAAFFVHSSITKKLEKISNLSNANEVDPPRAEKALMFLQEADNSFQESLIGNNKGKTAEYKNKLSLAFKEIDTLLKKQADTTRLTLPQKVKVKYWYEKKIELSNNLVVLKHNFDSLLNVYAGIETQPKMLSKVVRTTVNKAETEVVTILDTVKNVETKKGLFKRLKDAISNKADVKSEIIYKTDIKEPDIINQEMVSQSNMVYNEKLQQLQRRNARMLSMQSQLIVLNSQIIGDMVGIINKVKDINYSMADEFKNMALKSYQESTSLLNRLYLIALFLVMGFAILLFLFIIQLNKSEQQLRKEVVRSAAIAQQKMELLQHVSHEIRNPLTAIHGFLYIFSKSPMSPKQADMLESITLSSEMVLQTLTDTLDAAKMESSEIKINPEPFNPYRVVKQIVESMVFSANKKLLSMDYNFSGDKSIDLVGDSFRLKQIMVNLLSNAIKYTDNGGITVNVKILSGAESRLQVEILDTGNGIAIEQQENLFDKYYQTNSSKGQVGTGLGLFICKQLVELQNGDIWVKSNLGEGCTFTFVIPYPASSVPAVLKTDESLLSLLQGKNILAVDDNPINLLYIKKLTEKWKVIFHQASNGKEALDIISTHNITLVLTDLQMPEMDGETLLRNIQGMNAPVNLLPVIVISGNTTVADQQRLFSIGFSGIISKPFAEAEVMEQLIQALNKKQVQQLN